MELVGKLCFLFLTQDGTVVFFLTDLRFFFFFNFFFDLRSCLGRSSEWGSCYPPASYPHVMLPLHWKNVRSALLTQTLSLKILVISYCLQLHQITTRPWQSQLPPENFIYTYAYLGYWNIFAALPVYLSCLLLSSSHRVSWSHGRQKCPSSGLEHDTHRSVWWLCYCAHLHVNQKPEGQHTYSNDGHLL